MAQLSLSAPFCGTQSCSARFPHTDCPACRKATHNALLQTDELPAVSPGQSSSSPPGRSERRKRRREAGGRPTSPSETGLAPHPSVSEALAASVFREPTFQALGILEPQNSRLCSKGLALYFILQPQGSTRGDFLFFLLLFFSFFPFLSFFLFCVCVCVRQKI